jgi:GNAT superfamily N-acetyltransferase
MELRPIMPSDEFSSRNFFYSLQERTIYHRFFYKRRIFRHKEVQDELANVDYHQNMTLIGLILQGGHKEIMAVASYAQEENSTLAEVAFVVGEDFQGLGVASIMMAQLESIARKNGLTGFTAVALKENKAMQHVFKKRYPNSKIEDTGQEVYFTMMFNTDNL